jgi:galactokinase
VCVIDAVSGDAASCAIDANSTPSLGHWRNYPETVVRRVARNFPGARVGADIAFASDLPLASGMSSSSALMIAVFLGLAHVNRLDDDPAFVTNVSGAEALAGYLATIENGRTFGALTGDRGVGTFGGSEDHTAILCCQAGTLSQFRFAPVMFESHVPMPAGYCFVVAVSGVEAEKTGTALAAYNRASMSATRALELWQRDTGRTDPTLASALASSEDAASRLRSILSRSGDADFGAQVLCDRVEQFRVEHGEIIPAATEALRRGDLTRFGILVDRSQDAAERWLGNQIPETIYLARAARECGAVAASAFGAGFGGSVWAMVATDDVLAFSRRWSSAYANECPRAASGARFIETSPGPSARLVLDVRSAA